MILNKDKFHSFDALRFLSFLIVFTSHQPFDLFPKSCFTILKDRGHLGVYFFFTLSGFLITYILLNEKTNNLKINLKKFYIRRILRIWPLFYLMVLFAYLSPQMITFLGMRYSTEGYEPNYFLTCLFLENYHTIFTHQFPNVMPLPVFWSLCIEEHFYIIWGLLLYYTNIKKIPYLILCFLILPIMMRHFFLQNNFMILDLSTNIDLFMYGALPAYLYVNHKQQLIDTIQKQSNYLKALPLVLVVAWVLFSGSYPLESLTYLEPSIMGILCSLLLFVFLPSKNNFKITDANALSKLGLFTYSLYLIHFITISLLKKLTLKWNFSLDQKGLTFFVAALLLTILVSYISYHFIEKPFLKLKRLFDQNKALDSMESSKLR